MVYRPKLPLSGRAYVYDPEGGANAYPFYLTSAGHYACGAGFITRRSGRRDYQLLHTVSGEGYFIACGVTLRLQPGSYALIDCDAPHEYGTLSAEWAYEYLHFAGNGMRPYKEKLLGEPCVAYPRDVMLLNVYFERLTARPSAQNDVAFSSASAAIAFCLSAIMADKLGRNPPGAGKSELDTLEPALHYIHLHYAEGIALDDLLKVTYLSRFYFCRRFKSLMGCSPYQYVTRLRMEKARELLLTTSKPVSLIAKLVGFSGSGQFIRQFDKYAGQTPSEARKSPSANSRGTGL